MDFPKFLIFQLKPTDVACYLDGIVCTITLYANSKNNYAITSSSDTNGLVVFPKQLLIATIKRDMELSPMDYASLLEDCKGEILFQVLDQQEILKRIDGIEKWWSHLDSTPRKLHMLKNASNGRFKSVAIGITIGQGIELQVVDVGIEPSNPNKDDRE